MFHVPTSVFLSAAASQVFHHEISRAAPPSNADVLTLRRHYAEFNDRLLDRALARYPVDISAGTEGGVPVQFVKPRPPRATQSDRALICLHGGAFLWGSGSGALVEAVPMAAAFGAEVVAVDYRLAPEHVFPAASEDVECVYRSLLDRYPHERIGIYGCSAGGVLTAQAVAWFIHRELPVPGAIAMICGGGIELDGDSAWTAPILTGDRRSSIASDADDTALRLATMPYLAGADPTSPLVFPATSSQVLAGFPPSLLITASRDFAASGLTTLHRFLTAAGVDARLFVFDGLWHAFQIYPELPESQELHTLMSDFFDRTLGRDTAGPAARS